MVESTLTDARPSVQFPVVLTGKGRKKGVSGAWRGSARAADTGSYVLASPLTFHRSHCLVTQSLSVGLSRLSMA